MNLDQIETKCFILALFIRDDDERFLLGSRAYEFVDSQLHFTANVYQNDIVEVQGNDGVMLAGQVRRGQSQAFDGYIGDSSVDRSTIEQYRQNFLKFFRKNHYYKVVYIFSDGSAIQRRQGFIVEAPEVKELYQLFPQYHISMNFEDINYYNYEEDDEGQEIYGESATLKVATSATGGLIWAGNEQSTVTEEGTDFTIQNTSSGTVLSSVQLKGDTTQQTYSGKNLMPISAYNADENRFVQIPTLVLSAGTYTASFNIDSFALGANTEFPFRLALRESDNTGHNIALQTVNNSTTIGAKVVTFTITYDAVASNNTALVIPQTNYDAGGRIKISNLQIESGNQATSFEPYVGGIPSPNPDYPQEVQIVTGRQVVTITDGGSESQEYEVNFGKNLLPSTNLTTQTINDVEFTPVYGDDGKLLYVNANGTSTGNAIYNVGYVPNFVAGKEYTISGCIGGSTSTYRIWVNSAADGAFPSGNRLESANGPITRTASTNESNVLVYIQVKSGTTLSNFKFYPQIELGSTATTYSAYFTPIELCKIGTYQDYIYKSGSDWYVRKEIESITYTGDASESWSTTTSGSNRLFYITKSDSKGGSSTPILSNRFIYDGTTNKGNHIYINTNKAIVIINPTSNGTLVATTTANFKTWLSTNNVTVYYPLATATDTQITNAALVAQLNALAGATTYDGQTVFTVTSENQLAILNVSVLAGTGGGVVWDNYGAEWEEGTGGGPTMISVDSIDNVYPVWELTGPAVNPQISVLTTNTTLTYTGSITASQTLSIDMFNKTATLNGTSVIGNVSGDWVYLKPGINRVTYTTTNADAPDSTIWWQEIVG